MVHPPVISFSDVTAVKPTRHTEHYAFGDALRAVAILFVVAAHIVPDINFLTAIKPVAVPIGCWGVDAFFVLSGFLLGGPYIDALLGRRTFPHAMLYARRRFLRIWPAYAVVVLIGAALQNIHHGQHSSSPTDVVAHLTMLHGFSAKYIWGAGNMPLWTMAVDAQFYVALPIAAWAMLRLSGKRGELRSRVILGSIGGAVALSLAWRIFATYTFPTQVWPPSADLQVVQRGIVGMGMCFALGGLVAFSQARGIVISTAVAVVFFAIGVCLTMIALTVAFWCPPTWLAFAPTLIDFIGACSVSCLIFGGMRLQSTPVGRFVDSRPVAGFAVYAYALYLVHEPLKLVVFSMLERYNVHVDTLPFSLWMIGIFSIAAALAAWLLHHVVEQPFLTMKERARETAVAAIA